MANVHPKNGFIILLYSYMKVNTIHLNKLDGIRGMAACYVVLQHFIAGIESIPDSIKKSFFSFGQEAVMVFFLLSGFVICWSVNSLPNLTFKSYFIRRFRRIYFPFFIALALSSIIAYLNGDLFQHFSLENFIGNLFMLQDFSLVKPGTWFKPFLSNYPLWSLSYEWWFYILFFPCYYILPKSPKRIYIILGISALSFLTYNLIPNQISLWLSYYIIWWSGVELAEIYIQKSRFTFDKLKPIFISILLMIGLETVPFLHTPSFKPGYYPFLTLRHFLAAFAALLIGYIWYNYKWLYFEKTIGIFSIIAPISYGLYIFHYPILNYLQFKIYGFNLWIIYMIKFALLFVLAYVTEIKLQPLVNKFILKS